MVDRMFDERYFSDDEISWECIKIGDVVLEGDINYQYRTITDVVGKCWEYFGENDGYYHNTSPEYCHWLVEGQKGCKGRLLKIIY